MLWRILSFMALQRHGKHADAGAIRVLPPTPIDLKLFASPTKVQLGIVGPDSVLRFASSTERAITLNPVTVRDEFLAVTESSGALQFLSQTGRFFDPDDDPTEITWNDFQLWQQVVRSGMLYGPLHSTHGEGRPVKPKVPTLRDEPLKSFLAARAPTKAISWLSNDPGSDFRLQPVPSSGDDDSGRLLASVHTYSTLNAMLSAAYVDRLTNVRYQICELQECMNLYEVTSKQPRQYCSQVHAQRDGIRRKRAAERVSRGAGIHHSPTVPQPIRSEPSDRA